MWSNGIWEGLVTFFIVCLVLALGVGMALVWLAPKVWDWIKPIIHAATA